MVTISNTIPKTNKRRTLNEPAGTSNKRRVVYLKFDLVDLAFI